MNKLTIATLAVLALLGACGGGGQSQGAASVSGGVIGNSTSVPTISTLTITGRAANTIALSGATVDYVCAAGTASVSTGTDGSYKATVADGKWPCIGELTSAGTTPLHTVANGGAGNSATAQITPLTELVVAKLAGTDAKTFFSNFKALPAADKSLVAADSKVQSAQTAVKTVLAAAGISTLGAVDLLVDALQVNTASDAHGAGLQSFNTKLAGAGTTLGALVSSLVATPPPGAGTEIQQVATAQLLQPAVVNCPGLRGGIYRYINFVGTDKVYVDAEKLTVTNSKNYVTYLKPVDGDACHFKGYDSSAFASASPSDLVVSQAGIVLIRGWNDLFSNYALAIAFPEQTGFTLADVAGDWNALSMEADIAQTYVGALEQSTIGSDGVAISVRFCQDPSWDVSSCKVLSGTELQNQYPRLSINKDDNGFYLTGPGKSTPGGRLFAYRSGTGDLFAVNFWTDGSFGIATRQRTLAAPTVGSVTNSWNLQISNALVAADISSGTTTIVSVADAKAASTSYLRTNQTTGLADLHSETLTNNMPYSGFRQRAAGKDTSVTPNQSFSRLDQLPLQGMGITISLNETNKRFQVSVQKPN